MPHAVIVLTQKKLPGVSVSRCDARCSLRLVLVWGRPLAGRCQEAPSSVAAAAGFAAGKRCARTPWAASFEAILLLHSEVLKKPSFSSSSIKLSSKSCSMTESVIERPLPAERIICTPVCSLFPRTTPGEIRDQIKGLVWATQHPTEPFEGSTHSRGRGKPQAPSTRQD